MVFVALVSAFLLSVLFVAFVLNVSKKRAWYDGQDERKVHSGMIPRLGGVGFAMAYLVSIAVLMLHAQLAFNQAQSLPVVGGMFIVFIFGALDDFYPLRPRYKLLVQSISALIVLLAGYAFHGVVFPATGFALDFGWFSYPLTFIWIVGITNAINLIDGIDGLAGGVSALIALTYGAIFAWTGNNDGALLCGLLAVVIAGFLVFNLPFPHARIFMGDCGSQFLGFALAVLPLLKVDDGSESIRLPFAAAILLIPIFDTFSAIWRRKRDGRRFDSPDKAHTHHKLMNIGLRFLSVDMALWSLQIVISILVYSSIRLHGFASLVLLLSAYIIALVFFIIIHFWNRSILLAPGRSETNPGSTA